MDTSFDSKEPEYHFIREGKIEYSLKQRIEMGLSKEETKNIVKQILGILRDFHSGGRVLRFVTPMAFLLDKKDNIVAFDIVFSDFLEDGYSTKTNCYNSEHKNYSAPELFAPGHKHGIVSDFYSLGVLIYQMITGEVPYVYSKEVGKINDKCRRFWFKPEVEGLSLEEKRKMLVENQKKKSYPGYNGILKISRPIRNLVKRLMICNPEYRLGSEGIEEIFSHPWLMEESE